METLFFRVTVAFAKKMRKKIEERKLSMITVFVTQLPYETAQIFRFFSLLYECDSNAQ